MQVAIEETERRRAKQIAYNEANGIDPTPLRKKIGDITDLIAKEDADTAALLGSGRRQSRGSGRGAVTVAVDRGDRSTLAAAELVDLIEQLTAQMHAAAEELQFEVAARYRDEVAELKKELRQMQAAGHA
jgi:excinuclease ABC subunit B